MQLRLSHPEIARGTSTVLESPDDNVALIAREYDGQRLLMILNMNIDDYTLTVPEGFTAISGELEVWGSAALEGNRLTIPRIRHCADALNSVIHFRAYRK